MSDMPSHYHQQRGAIIPYTPNDRPGYKDDFEGYDLRTPSKYGIRIGDLEGDTNFLPGDSIVDSYSHSGLAVPSSIYVAPR